MTAACNGCCGTRPFTLGVAVVTLVATIWLYVIVPKGLLPQQDTGLIIGVTDAAQSISFKDMVARQRAIADIVRRDPDVVSVASFVGAGTREPDGQFGPPLHQPQAARQPQGQRRARSSTACAPRPTRSRASPSSCRRRRTCRLTAASAAPNTNTR